MFFNWILLFQLQDLRKKMDLDAGSLDQLEESKKRLQRDLDEKVHQLEERTAQLDKVKFLTDSIFHRCFLSHLS